MLLHHHMHLCLYNHHCRCTLFSHFQVYNINPSFIRNIPVIPSRCFRTSCFAGMVCHVCMCHHFLLLFWVDLVNSSWESHFQATFTKAKLKALEKTYMSVHSVYCHECSLLVILPLEELVYSLCSLLTWNGKQVCYAVAKAHSLQ